MSTSVFILCLVKCMAFVGWYVHRLKLGIFYIISNEAKVYKRRVSTMSTSLFFLCIIRCMACVDWNTYHLKSFKLGIFNIISIEAPKVVYLGYV